MRHLPRYLVAVLLSIPGTAVCGEAFAEETPDQAALRASLEGDTSFQLVQCGRSRTAGSSAIDLQESNRLKRAFYDAAMSQAGRMRLKSKCTYTDSGETIYLMTDSGRTTAVHDLVDPIFMPARITLFETSGLAFGYRDENGDFQESSAPPDHLRWLIQYAVVESGGKVSDEVF
jgi:hypothetical protein